MSNTVIKGVVVFSCDEEDCDEYLETDESRFEDANTVRRDEGWIAFKDPDGEWEHRCPTCRGRG